MALRLRVRLPLLPPLRLHLPQRQARAKTMSPCLNFPPYLLFGKLTSPRTANVPKRNIYKLISLNLWIFFLLDPVQRTRQDGLRRPRRRHGRRGKRRGCVLVKPVGCVNLTLLHCSAGLGSGEGACQLLAEPAQEAGLGHGRQQRHAEPELG